MSKQKPKITGLEDWQKRKSHLKGRSTLEEKEIEFLNCATKLGKNILDNKEEGLMSKHADNTFGNLVHTNLKQLPKRLNIAC